MKMPRYSHICVCLDSFDYFLCNFSLVIYFGQNVFSVNFFNFKKSEKDRDLKKKLSIVGTLKLRCPVE